MQVGTIYRNGQYYGGTSGGATAELDRHEIGYGNDESNIVGSGLFIKKNANIVEDLCEEQQSNSLEFIIDSTTDGDMPAGTITISNGTLETDYDSTQYVKNYEGHGYIGPINYSVSKDKNYTIKFIFETFNKDLADKDYYLSFIGYEDYANINLHKSITSVQEAGATVYYVTCTVNTNEAFTDYIVFPLTTGQDLAIYNGNADQNGGKFFLKNKGILCISGNNLTTLDGNTKFTMHDNAEMDLTGESIILMDDEGIIFGNATGTASFTIEELNNLKNGSGGTGDNSSSEFPIASKEILGGVKIGETLTIDGNGVLNVVDSGCDCECDNVGHFDRTTGTPTTGEIFNSYSGVNINKATGSYSHAEGSGTTASTYQAHAEGLESTAGGNASHAEGYRTYAGNTYAHAEGEQTRATGIASHTEGRKTEASAEQAHAEGLETKALDPGCHAEGYYTIAGNKDNSAYAAHAEGNYSKAEANYTHAEGDHSEATNTASHAEGYYTKATGIYTHAEGFNSIAEGAYSHAQGFYTIAKGESQFAAGKYNIADNTYAVIIGGGTGESNRKNIFTIDWSGNIEAGVCDADGNITYGTINGVDITQIEGGEGGGSSLYELPTASPEMLGGVKVSESAGLQVNENGELDLKIKIVPCTQEQYDALTEKDPNTLYLIGD